MPGDYSNALSAFADDTAELKSENLPLLDARDGQPAITVENLVRWSPAVEVPTSKGPRMLRKAPADSQFWAAWRGSKELLKSMGVSCTKNNRTGGWEAVWWLPLPQEVLDARRKALEDSRAVDLPPVDGAEVAASRATDAEIQLPAPRDQEYLGFQRAGIAYMLKRPSTLLADEMGLGKTIQAIGLMNADETLNKVLIICPASLKLNWHRELNKWLIHRWDYQIGIVDGRKWPWSVRGQEKFIVIMNYDVLARHEEIMREVKWDLIVCDEAHYLKNKKALRTMMVVGGKRPEKEEKKPLVMMPSALARAVAAQEKKDQTITPLEARTKVMITGTPIVNRPMELWTLIHFLDPGTWNNWFKFKQNYCCDWNPTQFNKGLAELQTRLRSTIMIRRLKADVLTDLPAKMRQVVEFEPEGEAAIAAIAREKAAAKTHEQKLARLRAQMEIAKASDDEEGYRSAVDSLKEGAAIAFTEMSKVRHETAIAKLPQVIGHLKSVLEESDDKKVIVFAHHRDVVESIAKEFDRLAVVIYGGMSAQEKQVSADRFQKDPTVRLIVGSFGPMGTGWTLTASSHVVMAELDWVPGNISQAEDRAHRIGQTDSVFVQHLTLAESMDATMAKKVVEKQRVIDKAMNDKDSEEVQKAITMQLEAVIPTGDTNAPLSLAEEDDHVSMGGKGKKKAAERFLTADQKAMVHEGLRILAFACDGAVRRDESGFNMVDAYIGMALAEKASLSHGQIQLGWRLCRKYRRQLPESMKEALQLEAMAP